MEVDHIEVKRTAFVRFTTFRFHHILLADGTVAWVNHPTSTRWLVFCPCGAVIRWNRPPSLELTPERRPISSVISGQFVSNI